MELTGNVQGLIDLVGGGSEVEYTQILESGEKIGIITIDDVPTDIYAPDGCNVEVTQVVSSGTKIATITVDDTPTDIYAPEGGSSVHEYSHTEQIVGRWNGENIYEKTFDVTPTVIYTTGTVLSGINLPTSKIIFNAIAINDDWDSFSPIALYKRQGTWYATSMISQSCYHVVVQYTRS